MRFKNSMIKDLVNFQEKTVIFINEMEPKKNDQTFNPKSSVLEAKLVYK